MKQKEYFITKLSFRDTENLIRDVTVYDFDREAFPLEATKDRQWLVNIKNMGHTIYEMFPNPNESNKWIRGNEFIYQNGYFNWTKHLPQNITKHKTFVSYYHKENQDDREKFENIFGDLIVSKSVGKDDIDSDNSDEYIKQLIQEDYLSDTTLLVVLIGPKTKCRKHVDWEISGALNRKIGENCAGLLGILLPSHPDYGKEEVSFDLIPPRLADNIKTGYAIIRDWIDDRAKLQSYIELAFNNRTSKADKRINSRIQMTIDTCS